MFTIIRKEVGDMPELHIVGEPKPLKSLYVYSVMSCPSCGNLLDVQTAFDLMTRRLTFTGIEHRSGTGTPIILESNDNSARIKCPRCSHEDDIKEELFEFPQLWWTKRIGNSLTAEQESRFNELMNTVEVNAFLVREHISGPV